MRRVKSPSPHNVPLRAVARGISPDGRVALEERTVLARKLYNQARSGGHRLLAETWRVKVKEFERATDIVRSSTHRMDRLVAQADIARKSAAE